MSVVTADKIREGVYKMGVSIKVMPVNAGGFALWKIKKLVAEMSDGQLLEEYARFKVEEEGK